MITDEDLLLYHYRDGLDPAERARIGAALGEQPELAQRLHALVARLDKAAAIPEVPVPLETQRRWEAALQDAVRSEAQKITALKPRATRSNFIPWAAAAAVAVVALILVIPGRNTGVETPQVAETPAPTGTSAYERGLKVHLASTEQQIAGLGSATPEERARLIETIIAQNRIYALAAERAGEPQLARVLRAFSPVLEGLKQGGDSSASLAQLSFELRVMQGRLGAGTASTSEPTTL